MSRPRGSRLDDATVLEQEIPLGARSTRSRRAAGSIDARKRRAIPRAERALRDERREVVGHVLVGGARRRPGSSRPECSPPVAPSWSTDHRGERGAQIRVARRLYRSQSQGTESVLVAARCLPITDHGDPDSPLENDPRPRRGVRHLGVDVLRDEGRHGDAPALPDGRRALHARRLDPLRLSARPRRGDADPSPVGRVRDRRGPPARGQQRWDRLRRAHERSTRESPRWSWPRCPWSGPRSSRACGGTDPRSGSSQASALASPGSRCSTRVVTSSATASTRSSSSIAPAAWALGSVWSKRLPLAAGAMATATQMLVGGIIMLGVSAATGERVAEVPSVRSIAAVLYLVVFGSLVAYSAYTRTCCARRATRPPRPTRT